MHEPDMEEHQPFALRAKHDLGRFPVLGSDDVAASYEVLWHGILGGNNGIPNGPMSAVSRWRNKAAKKLVRTTPREVLQASLSSRDPRLDPRLRLAATLSLPRRVSRPGRVVVKSVHAPLALEWIHERWNPRTIVVMRHPLNTLASWTELELRDRDRNLDQNPLVRERYVERWGIEVPPEGASSLTRAAWHFGLFRCALQEVSARHPQWHVVQHEDICLDPVERLRGLAQSVGLQWTEETQRFAEESNRPGTGYKVHRVAEEQVERWRSRLTQDQVNEIRSVLEEFPINGWPHRDEEYGS